MLKDQKEFFKVCFDTMQMGILVYDINKKIVLSNTPLNHIFGYNEECDLLNVSLNTLFNNDKIFDVFIIDSANEKFKKPIELIGIQNDGTTVPMEVNLSKLQYKNQFYFKAFISDITERKKEKVRIFNLNLKLEEEVKSQHHELEKAIDQLKTSLNKEKELNHLKTKFITLASHEFKTPLSAILSSTELIVKYSDLNALNKRNEHLGKVKKMIYHLNGMLDDFLTLENIELGNFRPKYSVFNFGDLINEIIENTKPFLKENQTLFLKNNNFGSIYQDQNILKIIITNLLHNAIKYSNEHDIIQIEIESKNSSIFLKVKDSGIGIPKNEQELIFKRFFRAKNAVFLPGTGIGLNIVKGYVDKLEGSIEFESIENKGTLFIVKLPKINSNEKVDIIN